MKASGLGRAIAWSCLLGAVAANVAGYVFDLYQRLWWFDRALHAATLFAITLWLALFVFGEAIRDRETVLAVILLASVGLALGGLWEILEWTIDQLSSGDVIKGKNDTILDLVMDTVGALSAAFVARVFLKPSRDAGG